MTFIRRWILKCLSHRCESIAFSFVFWKAFEWQRVVANRKYIFRNRIRMERTYIPDSIQIERSETPMLSCFCFLLIFRMAKLWFNKNTEINIDHNLFESNAHIITFSDIPKLSVLWFLQCFRMTAYWFQTIMCKSQWIIIYSNRALRHFRALFL